MRNIYGIIHEERDFLSTRFAFDLEIEDSESKKKRVGVIEGTILILTRRKHRVTKYSLSKASFALWEFSEQNDIYIAATATGKRGMSFVNLPWSLLSESN
ncbi:MAG: hypothetical protein P4L69_20475 [Desulfosporosinus sp.]|nr:hypothetical protein [Desulfosporosinus sp.]